MAAKGNWDTIIKKVEAQRFVGRGQEIDAFRRQLGLNEPDSLIFYITGQGGVGKSTLLNRYKDVARESNFLLAGSDEQERDVPAVLGRFAQQLADQDMPLKRFHERYKTYKQKMNEIESDPEAPQGLASLLGRTLVRATFVVGDMVPGVRKGLDIVPQDVLETQASQWASYLAKKLTNKDDVALIRDPVPILTPLFFDELNEIAEKRGILLCFENFEVTRRDLQDWLMRLREYKPLLNIRLAIAARDMPGPDWDALRIVTMVVCLDVFTPQEAEAFLDVYEIKSVKRRTEILECSGRLPVIMSWLAVPEGNELDTSLPTQNIVERFLRWINEPALREIALSGAMPRIFNADILTFLLEKREQATGENSAFDWLLTMPFVQPCSGGWRYHGIVRTMMLYYQRQKSPQTYRKLHSVLANFYDERLRELGCVDEECWLNEEWRKSTLAHSYHFLVSDSVQHWINVMDLFTLAVRKHRSFAIELAELFCTNDVQNELSPEQCDFARLLYQQLQAIRDKNVVAGFEMFDRLCRLSGLSDAAKGYALTYRGECYRLNGKWEDALGDFDKAQSFIPNDVRAITRRGVTYILMSRYEDALGDLSRAITLDKKDVWAIAIRGETYRRMRHYQDALIDLDKAITLDEKTAWPIAIRGETYRLMGRYQEALADLERALALDEKETWVLAIRGDVYRRMGRYEDALTDLQRAIALDEKNIWSLLKRGEAYYSLGRYEDALADLNRARTLDDKLAQSLATRGPLQFFLAKPLSPDPKDSPYTSSSIALTPAMQNPYSTPGPYSSGAPNPPMPAMGLALMAYSMSQSYSASPYPGAPNPPMPDFNNTPGYYGPPTNNLQNSGEPVPPIDVKVSSLSRRSRRKGAIVIASLILLLILLITAFLLIRIH